MNTRLYLMRGAGIAVIIVLYALIFGGHSGADTNDPVLVETVGEGRAPMKGPEDLAAARRIALLAAKRDAVEKALGAYVSLEKGPDRERIYTSSLAGLRSYVVEEEREEKGFFYTRIRAKVPVPDKFLRPPDAAGSRWAEGFEPLVETYPWGEIDWKAGMITAKGEGRLRDTGDPHQAQLNARRAAVVDARGNMLKIIFKIRIDHDATVEDKASGQEIAFKLEGFIRGAEIVHEAMTGKPEAYTVTLRAPVHGVRGLSSLFFDAQSDGGTPAGTRNGTRASTDTYTVIIFDARGTSLNPALFPRVLDPAGREVYSVRTVWKESALERGLAVYAAFEPGKQIVPSDLTRAPGDEKPMARYAFMKRQGRAIWIPLSRAEEKTRTRRRGFNPVVVDTDASKGKLATNLVISQEDAEKLEKIDRDSHLLKDCRVLIIRESAVGGIEGLLMARNRDHSPTLRIISGR